MYLLSSIFTVLSCPHFLLCISTKRLCQQLSKLDAVMPRFPSFCRIFLKSSVQMVNLITNSTYRQPIYKLTTSSFSCFDTWLSRYSWIFFSTSSKLHKRPVNLASQLLAMFVAAWLSMWPEAALV